MPQVLVTLTDDHNSQIVVTPLQQRACYIDKETSIRETVLPIGALNEEGIKMSAVNVLKFRILNACQKGIDKKGRPDQTASASLFATLTRNL